MPTTADVARAYTKLLRNGEFAAAGKQFWSVNIERIEPRENNPHWFDACRIDDLTIDGPFVTGNQFALFMDMMITNRASGNSQPFTEIAIFNVRDGRITEERFFYD